MPKLNWYKGNIHTHTNVDGGDDTPDRAGGLITKSWVHFALVLDKSQVGAYIDGEPVTRYG